MRSFVFGLTLGALFGFFAAIVVLHESQPQAPAPSTGTTQQTTIATPTSDRGAMEAELARRLHGASDVRLAETLDDAAFERDWSRVKVVSRVLRSRTRVKPTSTTNPTLGGVSGDYEMPLSLVGLEQEYRRRAYLQELRLRDDPATRLIARASEDDAVQKLVELLEGPAANEDDATTRANAARVLAIGATDKGRETLARALRDDERGAIAAEALGRSEDPKAYASLIELLQDPEPKVRGLVAQALGLASVVSRADPPDACSALAKVARSDSEDEVRIAALRSLGRADLARATEAREALSSLIAGSSDPARVRAAAIQAVIEHDTVAHATPADLVQAAERAISLERGRDGPLLSDLANLLGGVGTRASVEVLESARRDAKDPRNAAAIDAAIKRIRSRFDNRNPPPTPPGPG